MCNSPSLDTREWPAWAKLQLKNPNNHAGKSLENKEIGKDISDLMGSLALSEDSDVDEKLFMERRSSTIGSSTAFSNLIGLKFL